MIAGVAGPLRLATTAMGTRFELVIAGGPEAWLRTVGEAALEEIEACHSRLTRFEQDSLLAHIHREAFSHPVRLDADTFALFADALFVQKASGGAFDIDIGRAMDAWGVGDRPDAARASASFVLDSQEFTIRLLRPDVRFDLGGIAKGHAIDLAVRVLHENGVSCALLHGGTSSVRAIGAPPGTGGWRIRLGRSANAHEIELCDRALSVSSPAGDQPTTDGHILDPRTGTSVQSSRLVAVAGPTTRMADAWSTALAVTGERPETLGGEWYTHFG